MVVNSSLVMIEFINKSYRQGLSKREAIVQGANIRMRPIILTTLTNNPGAVAHGNRNPGIFTDMGFHGHDLCYRSLCRRIPDPDHCAGGVGFVDESR